MKTTYMKFKTGQKVRLNESLTCEGKHFDVGHEFSIISFPPCVTVSKHQYFVYGKDDNGFTIRCDINQIVK